MKEKEILRNMLNPLSGKSKELEREEDRELYLFLRGGFAAK
ncbi:MAG TPA: hypothetical protein VIO58_11315 [Candidatus Methanoperedens sp.]